jgi:hypothetical protein
MASNTRLSSANWPTVHGIWPPTLTRRFDHKRELALPYRSFVTSITSMPQSPTPTEGATVDDVIISPDSMRNAQSQTVLRLDQPRATMPSLYR